MSFRLRDPTIALATHAFRDEIVLLGMRLLLPVSSDPDAVARVEREVVAAVFCGRTGYARTAIDAGVAIVPAVFIGGQENQLYLSRGTLLARALRLNKLLRSEILPITFGFPVRAEPRGSAQHHDRRPGARTDRHVAQFGEHPDVDEVDAHVRRVMQKGLDELAAKRRFPILG